MGCSLQGSNPRAPPTSSSTPPGTRSRSVPAGRAPTAAARGSSEPTVAPPGGAAVYLGEQKDVRLFAPPGSTPSAARPFPPWPRCAHRKALPNHPPSPARFGLTSQQGAAGQGQQQAQRRAHPVPICSTWPRWVPRRARALGPPATTMGGQNLSARNKTQRRYLSPKPQRCAFPTEAASSECALQ